ncbi:MAG: tRNA (adenosine(37)-N6)-threonylcarbamoyltransferase complex transferase subunit TsaD [bacterium]
MLILGIESSCDETAAAVINGKDKHVEILSNVISSQINIHQKYGGVVPEIAAREHVLNIVPVINEALTLAGLNISNASNNLSAIAVTKTPGLVTSLISGIETAKALAQAWNLPLININHVEAHTYANFINNSKIIFPALILTVSGGHTNIMLMTNHGMFKIIGQTLDDAAGEAFDKAAKLLNIGYPGGPLIAQQATLYNQNTCSKKVKLPRPMINKPGFDFSFSGLKTALLYQLQKDTQWQHNISEYSHEFQLAVTETLIHQTIKAARKYRPKTILLAGGVAANEQLRTHLASAIKKSLPETAFFLPELQYTTDNAAMIATNGYFKFLQTTNK